MLYTRIIAKNAELWKGFISLKKFGKTEKNHTFWCGFCVYMSTILSENSYCPVIFINHRYIIPHFDWNNHSDCLNFNLFPRAIHHVLYIYPPLWSDWSKLQSHFKVNFKVTSNKLQITSRDVSTIKAALPIVRNGCSIFNFKGWCEITGLFLMHECYRALFCWLKAVVSLS